MVPYLSNMQRKAIAIYLLRRRWKKRKRRAYWVHPILQERHNLGQFNKLFGDTERCEAENYHNFFRMSLELFNELVRLVHDRIYKQCTNYRESISVPERLAITLRYLTHGDLQRNLSYKFRVGHQTVSRIIRETCDALWEELSPLVLPAPNETIFHGAAMEFWELWQFPNCCGAVDGRYIQIKAPGRSGPEYANCKKLSFVLLGLCDASYKFLAVEIGHNSYFSEWTFDNSAFGSALNEDQLKIPAPSPFPSGDFSGNYCFIGDETFPLKTNLMQPFPTTALDLPKAVFNYRLSRARHTIENTFGILAARFRILRRPMNTKLDTAICIVKACVCLHNFIKGKEDAMGINMRRYCPARFIDYEYGNGSIVLGEWRSICATDTGLLPISCSETNNCTNDAAAVRDNLMRFFMTVSGSLSWQQSMVQ